MTSRADIEGKSNYIPILDHGFVGLIDSMGSDDSIVEAARLSYAKGTKKVNENRGLIRYLMSHRHTSPFEMCVVKLHLKIPMFVMRQLVRHRTSSLNEMSARYSILPEEFYIPEPEHISPQSTKNKQGREGLITPDDKNTILAAIEAHNKQSYDLYGSLLQDDETPNRDKSIVFSEEYSGMTRELSRMVLPVNIYTELVWTQNLHNMLHLLKLRTDKHAQYEIQVLANAIYEHIVKLFPLAVEAWEDYVRDSITFSKNEMGLLSKLLSGATIKSLSDGDEKLLAERYGLNARELIEFKNKIGVV